MSHPQEGRGTREPQGHVGPGSPHAHLPAQQVCVQVCAQAHTHAHARTHTHKGLRATHTCQARQVAWPQVLVLGTQPPQPSEAQSALPGCPPPAEGQRSPRQRKPASQHSLRLAARSHGRTSPSHQLSPRGRPRPQNCPERSDLTPSCGRCQWGEHTAPETSLTPVTAESPASALLSPAPRPDEPGHRPGCGVDEGVLRVKSRDVPASAGCRDGVGAQGPTGRQGGPRCPHRQPRSRRRQKIAGAPWAR